MAKISPDLLKALSANQEADIEMLPGMAMDSRGVVHDSPKIREIISFLAENPIYVDPVLNFIREKRGEVSLATLRALYTPEQLRVMAERQGMSAEEQDRVSGVS